MFAFRAIHARESSIEEILWDSFFIGWQLGLHLRVLLLSLKQETSFIRDLMSRTVKHLTTEAHNSTFCRAMSTK